MWFGLGGRSARRPVRPRKAKRFTTDLLTCSIGEIVNLSAGGIRLRFASKPALAVGQVLAVTLQSPQAHLTLSARVIWIRRRGIRNARAEAGLQFVDMRPQMIAALEGLARFGFVPRTKIDPPPTSSANARATAGAAGVAGVAGAAGAAEDRLPDFYAILGLTSSATTEQIHAAYRMRVRLLHPDVNKAPTAAVEFDAVCKAYRVLRDPERREGYDLARSLAT
jgi:hypothetical protein